MTGRPAAAHTCTNSGQIGPIKVVRIERRNEKTRIHFVCGRRALADYASKHETVQSLAGYLTTSESELLPSVERMEAEIKQARKANTRHTDPALGLPGRRTGSRRPRLVGSMRIVASGL